MQETLEIRSLKRRVHRANQRIVNHSIIVEAIDQRTLDMATKTIERLRSLKGKGLHSLDTAIDAAVTELNRYLAGGNIKQALNKILKSGKNNVLVQTLALVSGLEKGFAQFDTLINNLLGSDIDKTKSVAELNLDPKQQKLFLTTLRKALIPTGYNKLPYVDMNMFLVDLIQTPVNKLTNVIATVKSMPPAEETLKAVKADTKQATSPEAPKPDQATQQTNKPEKVDAQAAVKSLARGHGTALLKAMTQNASEPGKALQAVLSYLVNNDLVKV